MKLMVLATLVTVVIMLLKPSVLAKLFLEMSTVKCNINWFVGNIAKPMVLATWFVNIDSQMYYQLFWGECCKTNGFNNIVLENVATPMVLVTLSLEML